MLKKPVQASHYFFAATIIGAKVFHLVTPLITVLFSFLLLSVLKFRERSALAVLAFVLIVIAVSMGSYIFVHQMVFALPQVASESIPILIETAKRFQIELPFTDWDSLRALAVDMARDEIRNVARLAELGVKETVLVILGMVVAINLFLNTRWDLETPDPNRRSFYTALTEEIGKRFRRFYESFSTVMGAQILISGINTFFTAIFVMSVSLRHAGLIIGLTFVCGLIPILGNLISNTIIVGIAVTQSLTLAVAALIFLVVLHKLEYFLNSKIVGSRIKNPMWLTLLSIVVGEQVMGLAGMVLAPVLVHYFKREASLIDMNDLEAS